MGVVSNGMLCSGDELELTGDADGILILPPDTPLGVAAGRPLRRRRPRRRRQAEPRRRPVDRRAGPRDLDRDRGPGPLPRIDVGRVRARRWRSARGRGPRSGPLPAVRRALGRATSAIGPSPHRGPGAPPGGRDAPGEQRRRRQQLRDARARQADPHVRRGARSTAAGSSSGGRTPGERIETLDHVDRTLTEDDPGHRRPGRPDRHRRGHGRRRVGDRADDDRRRHRVGDLRPGQHPADRPALRAPLRGEPPVREGPGGPPRPDRRRPLRPARRSTGPAGR